LEAGHRNAGDALRVFNEMKTEKAVSWARSIGSISFGTKAEFPALQAADLISYWFYKTEIAKLSGEIDNPDEISGLERELAHCGLAVMEHVVTSRDLGNLRQNFFAKKKRKVFNKVHAVMKAGDYLPGAWDTEYENSLVGVEFSEDLLDSAPSRRRQ
jgi:hypothetical protein